MEMEQLLSMGFPNELAAEALAATGGKSTLKATEWILSRRPSADPPPNNPSPSQPKLDRFFAKPIIPATATTTATASATQLVESAPPAKRVKTCAPQVPLSERMRPHTLHEVVGQDHLLSPTSVLGCAVDTNRLPSVILWVPPGTGKTSIAKAIVGSVVSSYRLVCLSAVTCGVKDVREVVEETRRVKLKNNWNKRTVLFVDEVHRFNKSQQDSFLPVIEDGSIVFIGATIENPSFHLITPLLFRCRVLTLNALKPCHVGRLLRQAMEDIDRGVGKSVEVRVEVKDDAIEFLSSNCDGDACVALNALEIY
ncbi:hypothetical protein Pint_36477 [Pistacia integerrima]|uniref:Uncharacterized protein n=1 Tax=Pistacia integerrima TaxID=434235 RepID=A0ACC0Y3F1_9ROSI|nr:hypothetical protein Pint_36477 [Pistacia integerrima]